MQYATIMPWYAIDTLCNIDLDVNFLWMPTKCDASLDFSFLMQMLFTRMQMQNVHMMQMSRVGVQMQSSSMMVPTHIFKPWCKCLLVGMPWCKCPLVGMPWCECFDANTIYSKIPFVFKIKASSTLETQIFSKFNLLFPKSPIIFYLKLPKDWWSLLEIFE